MLFLCYSSRLVGVLKEGQYFGEGGCLHNSPRLVKGNFLGERLYADPCNIEHPQISSKTLG